MSNKKKVIGNFLCRESELKAWAGDLEILCDFCKNKDRCKSFWKGSVNSINCSVLYGLFESIESEVENEKKAA